MIAVTKLSNISSLKLKFDATPELDIKLNNAEVYNGWLSGILNDFAEMSPGAFELIYDSNLPPLTEETIDDLMFVVSYNLSAKN